MANELVLAGGKFNRPSHLTVFEAEPSNLKVMSTRVPTMTIQGKVFAINADGKEARLVKEIDGDTIPIPSVPVVILGFNAARGRAYYEGTFDPKQNKPPMCWSRDSITPDDAVPEKQSERCATCKWSVKGSRISDNDKAVAACAEHRLVAVIPYKALHSDMPALRLRLPPTSDYDGQNKEAKAKDMYAFSQFIDFIRSRGVVHSYEMVVKMSFDTTPGITYPKLWFQAQGWVTAEDTARITELRADGGLDAVLSSSEGDIASQSGAAVEAKADAAPVTATARATAPKATTKAADKPAAAAAAPAAPKAPTAAEKAKAAAAAAMAEAERLEAEEAAAGGGAGVAMNLGDDGDMPAKASSTGNGTVAAAPVDAKAPPTAAHVDDKDVDDIMQQWAGD